MARPKSLVEEVDLIRWYTLNYKTRKLRIQVSDITHSMNHWRTATVWAMHQYDVRAIHAALCAKPVPKYPSYHKPEHWDIHRVVTAVCAIAGDEKATSGERERAIKQIREWHSLIARRHEDFCAERGEGGDPESTSSRSPDPLDNDPED